MCKFIQITNKSLSSQSLHYFSLVKKSMMKYSKYFIDDFAEIDDNFLLSKIPFLWAITTIKGEFMGFVFLDNFVGNNKTNFSAELTTCFEQEAWGSFTRYSAKFFLKKCFDELGLFKIRAIIYPQNFRIARLLKSSGFELEARIPKETLHKGILQDIDCYALYKSYYYKTEV